MEAVLPLMKSVPLTENPVARKGDHEHPVSSRDLPRYAI